MIKKLLLLVSCVGNVGYLSSMDAIVQEKVSEQEEEFLVYLATWEKAVRAVKKRNRKKEKHSHEKECLDYNPVVFKGCYSERKYPTDTIHSRKDDKPLVFKGCYFE